MANVALASVEPSERQRMLLTFHEATLRPDPARVLARPFRPAVEPRDRNPVDKPRANHIVDRIVGLPQETAERELSAVLSGFSDRHADLLELFDTRAAEMESVLEPHARLSVTQRRLIGSYFIHEYSFEATALFNPSIVPHPDQSGLEAGATRFVLSLRSVGEGHISSVTFRTGTVTSDGAITLDLAPRLASTPMVRGRTPVTNGEEIEVVFRPTTRLDERVIFPITEAQRNGIEDARFVFIEDCERPGWYATYTAYSGRGIRSELMWTEDFRTFVLSPMNGAAARNKGMALFPQKIDGRFAMIGRQDNENIFLIDSDDLLTWHEGKTLMQPRYPWEFIQLGNCGSPIDIGEYWLLLTHGVGAMRTYAIGAALLDKRDPSRIVARSREPLLRATGADREGYVPNVVYTCGAMRHGERIVMPYGVVDMFTRFASFEIRALLDSIMD
jgi:predicted GH43/DUF377 family glycosyl hydrolase